MKAIRALLIVSVLATLAAVVTPVGAVTSWNSCFQIANMDSAEATVSITFYDQNGSVIATINTGTYSKVPGNGKQTYCYLDSFLPSGPFNGSVVVESDKQIAAITNVMGDDETFWASYSGLKAGAGKVALPSIKRQSYNTSTWFNVQNTGTLDTNVLVTYSNGATETFSSLKPGASHTFDQASNTNLPVSGSQGWVGSAVVSTTTPGGQVAAVVMEVGPKTLMAYEGFAAAAKFPVIPLVNANNWNIFTGIPIQNTSGVDTVVRVAYTPGAGAPGQACYEQRTIPAGQARNFALFAFTFVESPADPTFQSDCLRSTTGDETDRTRTFVGSGRVVSNSANADLNVIVNQLDNVGGKGSSYNAFDPNDATSTVVFPIIMDRVWDQWTGISVVNVGTSNTNISCSFSGSVYVASATNVPPGKALVDTQDGKIGDKYSGAATCVASGGADNKIVGIANQTNVNVAYDSSTSYEGSNR